MLVHAQATPALAGDSPDPPKSAEASSSEAAPAGETPQQRAETLKAKGDAFFRSRYFVDAVAAYEESYATFPNARVLYNKARALQALGRFAEALTTLKRFEVEAPPDLKAQVSGLDALISELSGRVSEVTVRVNLPGAQITLGSDVLGTSPLAEPKFATAGKVKLRVQKEGYFSVEREVTLRGGSSASFDVTLEPKARFAKVVISSKVSGTTISVDGKSIGQVPTEVVVLPGTHQIVASRDGYTDKTQQIIVEAGQHRTLSVEPIEKQRAIYERWWFWGGIGVVAAATATTLILINNEPEPTEGNFSPSAISAPLTRF